MKATVLLRQLRSALLPYIPSIERVHSGLEARVEARYGPLSLVFDYDQEARSIRVYTMIPPPAGGGHGFFRWCLAMNTLYWDVKVGLDTQGMLLVMADVDMRHLEVPEAARVLLTRVSAIGELLDDDLVLYLMEHDLATPAQAERWSARRKPDPT